MTATGTPEPTIDTSLPSQPELTSGEAGVCALPEITTDQATECRLPEATLPPVDGGYCSAETPAVSGSGYFSGMGMAQLFSSPATVHSAPDMTDPQAIRANLEARLDQVGALLDEGNFQVAKENFQDVFRTFRAGYEQHEGSTELRDPAFARRIFYYRAVISLETGQRSGFRRVSQTIEFLNGQVSNNPNDAEAYLIRARLEHRLGRYQAAFESYSAAVGIDPSYRAEADGYLCRLERQLGDTTHQRQQAEVSGNTADIVLLLGEEVQILSLLGRDADVENLSPLLQTYTQNFSLEIVVDQTTALASSGFLTAENVPAEMSDYVEFSLSSDAASDNPMVMSAAFYELDSQEQLRVLGRLQEVGTIAGFHHRLDEARTNEDRPRE